MGKNVFKGFLRQDRDNYLEAYVSSDAFDQDILILVRTFSIWHRMRSSPRETSSSVAKNSGLLSRARNDHNRVDLLRVFNTLDFAKPLRDPNLETELLMVILSMLNYFQNPNGVIVLVMPFHSLYFIN